MPARIKDRRKVRNQAILIRFNLEEIELLDEAMLAAGYDDRAPFIRETIVARARGGELRLPPDAPAAASRLALVFGVWKALGGDYTSLGIAVEEPPPPQQNGETP